MKIRTLGKANFLKRVGDDCKKANSKAGYTCVAQYMLYDISIVFLKTEIHRYLAVV